LSEVWKETFSRGIFGWVAIPANGVGAAGGVKGRRWLGFVHSVASGVGFKRVVQPSESGMCFVCGGQGQRIRTKDTLVTFACAKTAAKLLEVVV
jgi:hypothetical protein